MLQMKFIWSSKQHLRMTHRDSYGQCTRCRTAQQAKAHCEALDWQLDEDRGEIISAKFAGLLFWSSPLPNLSSAFE
jgi:hypothetical protein